MKELTIISGKGGTGKTSVVASFAALAQNKVLADADVDAADLHLILAPEIKHEEDFKGGRTAQIDLDACTECEECLDRCQFKAISPTFVVDKIDCEGCGVCVHFCPVQAIDFPQNICGKWYISETRFGPMVHAKLGIAEENSGLLVSLVRNQAKVLAEDRGLDTIIVDGPPGIGCPVIASITGTSAILIVTEPTLSGLHDLERVGGLAAHFKIPTLACINKFDLNEEMSDQIARCCARNHIALVGRIPYDTSVTHAMVAGKSIVEFSDGSVSDAINKIWEKVENCLTQV
ncbi:MAG: ATP-binding protein [Deltaproteobacteria bacterium]|nr:ATP-binding protein [Deltaproteobacteria bacterium]MBW2075321.1 ATP-binding protein [Deltaproteobacteria bacterium]RLB80632.1 MAG: (4Fe-4S)-binding protein [Deltaproteobacteria bacterium]